MIPKRLKTKSGVLKLGREIGRGSFGVAYLAKNPRGREFALKLIGPIEDADEKLFERELNAACAVSHPNVLRLIDFGRHEDDDEIYLFTVTEFCDEGDFRKTVSRYRRNPLQTNLILSDFDQLLSGLSAVHEKIIHRDLKPENVFIKAGQMKVGDFGFAKQIDQATATLTFKGSGSPAYMAPEVWERKRATPATDLYAVGIMLFEAFTGQRPFAGEDIIALRDEHRFSPAPRARSMNPLVPEKIDSILKRLLDKEPSRRYQSADELRTALKAKRDRPSKDIGAIVRSVRARSDDREKAELNARQQMDDGHAESARIRYCEESLLALFDEVVEEVNAHLQEAEISRTVHSFGRSYGIIRRQMHVRLYEPGELFSNPRNSARLDILRRRNVIHGGYINIQENGEDREGWNLVLVRSGEESYGTWRLVESRPSALSSSTVKYVPVATPAPIFAENLALHWNNSMARWDLTDEPLEQEDVVSMFQILVQAR